MLDESSRRQKAAKILAVLRHFAGTDDLSGRRALDIGCSAGYIAHELYLAGAAVTGVDIDAPGIEAARARFGSDGPVFVEYDGTTLPCPDRSVDLVVYNHVYEHTVDPDAMMGEIVRALAPGGVVYLGLGNRLGVIEPHYRLPFLSWLPRRWADLYLRVSGRGDRYYERFLTRRGLRRMCRRLEVWDYTYSVLAQPEIFGAGDVVAGPAVYVPNRVWRWLGPLVPTYIWVGAAPDEDLVGPGGPPLRVPPGRVPPV